MNGIIKRYKAAWRLYGTLGLFEVLGCKVLRRMSINIKRTYVLKYDILDQIKKDSSFKEEYSSTILSAEDFINYSKEDRAWFSDAKLSFLLEVLKNTIAIGIIKDNKIISYGFINPNISSICGEQTKEKTCYLFDDYTHPKYRGKGLHLQSLNDRLKYSADLAFKEAYISVDAFNRASLKGVKRAGFYKYNRLTAYSFGKKRTKYLIKKYY